LVFAWHADRRDRIRAAYLRMKDANSREFDENSLHKVIDFMPIRTTRSTKAGRCASAAILASFVKGRR
jgi:CTP synthase (UTP-ammonia lyase)